jgi:hypothetical protein
MTAVACSNALGELFLALVVGTILGGCINAAVRRQRRRR